jgi:hypothetical protein
MRQMFSADHFLFAKAMSALDQKRTFSLGFGTTQLVDDFISDREHARRNSQPQGLGLFLGSSDLVGLLHR